ncbi:aminopeptidase P2, partial [Cyclospora cayetanensis]|uniref:Aminopeptidase P2 n=1 Tax=Cyclospora cayetanensis TaxID=88456 RepID=A0A6P6S0U3_9EIME
MWGRTFVCLSVARWWCTAERSFAFPAVRGGPFPPSFDASLGAFLSPKPPSRPKRALASNAFSGSSSSTHNQSPSISSAQGRLSAVRALMHEHQLDAWLVDDADAHGSEIPSPAFARRSFLSSFDGSNGLALLTQQDALLWTDGRYFTQAEQQLPKGLWRLMKSDFGDTPTLTQFLKQQTQIRRLGVDGFSTSTSLLNQIREAGFHLFRGASVPQESLDTSWRYVVPLEKNLVDEVWGPLRPPLPSSQVYVHPKEYRGSSTREKAAKAVEAMAKEGADIMLLSSLDDVAWLTNLRGADTPNSPLFYAYALLVRKTPEKSSGDGVREGEEGGSLPWRLVVYTDPHRVSPEARASLTQEGAFLRPYDHLASDIRLILSCKEEARQQQHQQSQQDQQPRETQQRQNTQQQKQAHLDGSLLAKVDWILSGGSDCPCTPTPKSMIQEASEAMRLAWLDPKINLAIHRIFAESGNLLVKETPVAVAKAAKDAREIKGMREAHEEDAVALATFFCWFEKQLLANAKAAADSSSQQQEQEDAQGCLLTEWTLKEAVDAARKDMTNLFKGPSFNSISCFGSNCALAHYRPDPKTSLELQASLSRSDGALTVSVRAPGGGPPAHEEVPMFLLDSGGQYLTGTTDVTRTLHLGSPTQEQKEAYTLVLKVGSSDCST